MEYRTQPIRRDQARRIVDAGRLLTEVALELVAHPELWGAISAAKAAVERCERIAIRDIEPQNQPEEPAKRKGRTR